MFLPITQWISFYGGTNLSFYFSLSYILYKIYIIYQTFQNLIVLLFRLCMPEAYGTEIDIHETFNNIPVCLNKFRIVEYVIID